MVREGVCTTASGNMASGNISLKLFMAPLETIELSIFWYVVAEYHIAQFTAQKRKFSVKDFFSKCDQILRFLPIWSHLLKKSLMKNFSFCAVIIGFQLLVQNNLFPAFSCHFFYNTLQKPLFTVKY